MNEKILQKYSIHLHGKYDKKNTIRASYYPVKYFLKHIQKPITRLTEEDMLHYKAYLNKHYKQNSRARLISSINQFLKYIKKPELKLSVPKIKQANKKILSEQEYKRYLETIKTKPLWHLISLLQTDGLLRPGEFSQLKLSNIDMENRRYYLNDTKTGDNYIIISPMIEKAIKSYLPYRNPKPEYKDYLIIIPNGRYKGQPPKPRGTYIRNITKNIAAAAKINKRVTPYNTIKPTTITLDFDHYVNPRIIQRKARHKNIKTTLIYDHTDDKKLLEHFEQTQKNTRPLTDEQRKRLLTDQYLQGELDLETYKRSLDLLDKIEHKKDEGVGYA
jgi:site-specific recombinase XerD